MATLRVGALPGEALAAAAMFHAEVLAEARAMLSKISDQPPLPLQGRGWGWGLSGWLGVW